MNGIADAAGDIGVVPCWAGLRRCPNPECFGLAFEVTKPGGSVLILSYPPVRLELNTNDIPKEIVECIDEALDCHANHNYIAAAIMVRRTLELICENKGATGKDLKERIRDLGTKIVIPKELLAAMDDLRVLGNDAAHVEAKAFGKISEEELLIAIEFAKEILKGVYQYGGLLAKLQTLKKPTP